VTFINKDIDVALGLEIGWQIVYDLVYVVLSALFFGFRVVSAEFVDK